MTFVPVETLQDVLRVALPDVADQATSPELAVGGAQPRS
jgi:hypothetical protein